MQTAVFLDRDGVINKALVRNGRPYAPRSHDDFQILPGVPDALAQLREAGLILIVVTNQPDVATGHVSRETVLEMNAFLHKELPLDDIRTCFHDDRDACDCRKPAPGLLQEAALQWDVDLSTSFMVGDRWRDVGAGKAAGCFTIFIDQGYTERAPAPSDATVTSLPEATKIILEKWHAGHEATGG